MTEMPATLFKATCLAVLDDVNTRGEPVLVTKNGRQVAKVLPAEEPSDPLALYRVGAFGACDDLDTHPVVAAEEWEMLG